MKETPEQSDRQIAKVLGVSNKTVSSTRKDMVDNGQLCNLHSSIGADGKERPRATKPKTVYQPPAVEKKSNARGEQTQKTRHHGRDGGIWSE
ncbi:MAG: hypothetical protein GY792_32840 [Gammaproteobacteria bacterium]|nr:hypothetical protein [Gammaproteobacteria bacterium]